jgi:hypothetical protein
VLADADSQGGSVFLTYFLHSHILFCDGPFDIAGDHEGGCPSWMPVERG